MLDNPGNRVHHAITSIRHIDYAQETDAAKLSPLWYEAYSEQLKYAGMAGACNTDDKKTPWDQQVAVWQTGKPHSVVIGAYSDERLLGFASVSMGGQLNVDYDMPYLVPPQFSLSTIQHLFVAHCARGLGIGKMLLSTAIQEYIDWVNRQPVSGYCVARSMHVYVNRKNIGGRIFIQKAGGKLSRFGYPEFLEFMW